MSVDEKIADYVERALQGAVDQGFERIITNPATLDKVSRLLTEEITPVPRVPVARISAAPASRAA